MVSGCKVCKVGVREGSSGLHCSLVVCHPACNPTADSSLDLQRGGGTLVALAGHPQAKASPGQHAAGSAGEGEGG